MNKEKLLLIVMMVVFAFIIYDFLVIAPIRERENGIELQKEKSTPSQQTESLMGMQKWESENPAQFKIYNGVRFIDNGDPYIILGIETLKRIGRIGILNVYIYERNYILSQQRNALFYPFIIQVSEKNMLEYFKHYWEEGK